MLIALIAWRSEDITREWSVENPAKAEDEKASCVHACSTLICTLYHHQLLLPWSLPQPFVSKLTIYSPRYTASNSPSP